MDSDIKKNQFLKSLERFRCVMGITSLNAGIFQSAMISLSQFYLRQQCDAVLR